MLISARCLANPNRARSHLSHIFWSSYEFLIHYQSGGFRAHLMVIQVPLSHVDC